MGFEGSATDAISRLKYNRGLLTSRRERYNRVKEAYRTTTTRALHRESHVEVSEARIAQIKAGIKRSMRREYTLQVVASIVLLLVIIAMVILVIKLFYTF